jgi:hypothetical protein
MVWPWEDFSWGVFWAMAAVLLLRRLFIWIGEVLSRWTARKLASGEVSKSSAVEFSHSTANAMTDLSLGQGILRSDT